MNQNQARKNQLKNNFKKIQDKIDPEVTLVAVSKKHPFSDIALAYENGHRDFAENRVEDLLTKAQSARESGLTDIRWHFIGGLQSNKISKLLSCPDLKFVHSVDREKIFLLLKNRCESEKLHLKYFLQVNTSLEDEKSGFFHLDELGKLQLKGEHFELAGLMTMSKMRTESFEADAIACFHKLKQMRDSLSASLTRELGLSMGMSSDYEMALDQGATYLRIGSLLFQDQKIINK